MILRDMYDMFDIFDMYTYDGIKRLIYIKTHLYKKLIYVIQGTGRPSGALFHR